MSENTTQGHLRAGCEGTWVDISSLSGKAWTCTVCRAIVTQDPEAPEELELPAELTPGQEANPAQRAAPFELWPILAGFLVGAIAGAIAMAVLTLVLSLFPHHGG